MKILTQHRRLVSFLLCETLLLIIPSMSQTENTTSDFLSRPVVPLSEYVSISPFTGSYDPQLPLCLDKSDIEDLQIILHREDLPKECGPQFIRITTTITNRDGSLYDKIHQFALTFPNSATEEEDNAILKKIADEVTLYGFVSRRKIDTVDVELDSIPDWAIIKIEVRTDEDYTKYTSRVESKQEFYYRAKGNHFESAFFLGIPKVLYDTNRKDTVTYGNTSAMLRFYLLDNETGSRFPLNIGVGTIGVSTPIDVSKSGGGFVISLLFDIVEMMRTMNVTISSKFNAGIEIAPFFPIAHQSRVLLNARIGYTP